jgi:hypothetical protein
MYNGQEPLCLLRGSTVALCSTHMTMFVQRENRFYSIQVVSIHTGFRITQGVHLKPTQQGILWYKSDICLGRLPLLPVACT